MSRGDFLIEALLRVLQIDRRINALLALRHGPAHPSLGKEYGQPDACPVVLEVTISIACTADRKAYDYRAANLLPISQWLTMVTFCFTVWR